MKYYVCVLFDFGHIIESVEYTSIYGLINNALANKFIIFDEKTEKEVDLYLSVKNIFDTLKTGKEVVWHAKKEGFNFKIVISRYPEEGAKIILYPMNQQKKKKDMVSGESELDLGFYIERVIELCEDFPIHELVAREE